MGTRITARSFTTRAEAEADQAQRGQPGYSERYPLGIRESRLESGQVIYISETKEYYG